MTLVEVLLERALEDIFVEAEEVITQYSREERAAAASTIFNATARPVPNWLLLAVVPFPWFPNLEARLFPMTV